MKRYDIFKGLLFALLLAGMLAAVSYRPRVSADTETDISNKWLFHFDN